MAVPPNTAAPGTLVFVPMYMDPDGRSVPALGERPTVIVHLSDDSTVDAWQLTQSVVDFWRKYFAEHDLPYTPQSDAEQFGTEEDEHEWTDPRDGKRWQVRAYNVSSAAAVLLIPDAFEDVIRFRSDPAVHLIVNPDARRPGEFSDKKMQDMLDAARAR